MKTFTLSALATSMLAAAGLAQAEAITYNVEPTHTYVTFEVRHFATSTNRGRFDKKEGSITIDRAAKTGKADITIDMTSISTGLALFDKHLRGENFFKAADFPTATFVGDKFTFDGDKVTAFTVPRPASATSTIRSGSSRSAKVTASPSMAMGERGPPTVSSQPRATGPPSGASGQTSSPRSSSVVGAS